MKNSQTASFPENTNVNYGGKIITKVSKWLKNNPSNSECGISGVYPIFASVSSSADILSMCQQVNESLVSVEVMTEVSQVSASVISDSTPTSFAGLLGYNEIRTFHETDHQRSTKSDQQYLFST